MSTLDSFWSKAIEEYPEIYDEETSSISQLDKAAYIGERFKSLFYKVKRNSISVDDVKSEIKLLNSYWDEITSEGDSDEEIDIIGQENLIAEGQILKMMFV